MTSLKITAQTSIDCIDEDELCDKAKRLVGEHTNRWDNSSTPNDLSDLLPNKSQLDWLTATNQDFGGFAGCRKTAQG